MDLSPSELQGASTLFVVYFVLLFYFILHNLMQCSRYSLFLITQLKHHDLTQIVLTQSNSNGLFSPSLTSVVLGRSKKESNLVVPTHKASTRPK